MGALKGAEPWGGGGGVIHTPQKREARKPFPGKC